VQYSVPLIRTNLGKITSLARDANSRDRDVVMFVEMRPRRDVGVSRDRDLIPDIVTNEYSKQVVECGDSVISDDLFHSGQLRRS